MAITKAKRSVHLSKEARRMDRRATTRHPDRSGSSAERRNQARSTSSLRRIQPASTNPKATTSRGLLNFPRLRGKVVKEIEFFVDPSHNCLLLRFQDNTSLVFDFATSFATEAHFSRWKAGNERVLHYWPRLQSEPIF